MENSPPQNSSTWVSKSPFWNLQTVLGLEVEHATIHSIIVSGKQSSLVLRRHYVEICRNDPKPVKTSKCEANNVPATDNCKTSTSLIASLHDSRPNQTVNASLNKIKASRRFEHICARMHYSLWRRRTQHIDFFALHIEIQNYSIQFQFSLFSLHSGSDLCMCRGLDAFRTARNLQLLSCSLHFLLSCFFQHLGTLECKLFPQEKKLKLSVA